MSNDQLQKEYEFLMESEKNPVHYDGFNGGFDDFDGLEDDFEGCFEDKKLADIERELRAKYGSDSLEWFFHKRLGEMMKQHEAALSIEADLVFASPSGSSNKDGRGVAGVKESNNGTNSSHEGGIKVKDGSKFPANSNSELGFQASCKEDSHGRENLNTKIGFTTPCKKNTNKGSNGGEGSTPASKIQADNSHGSSAHGLAQLCTLAYVKVPSLEEDFGQEAAEFLSERTLNSSRELRAQIEDRDTSAGKVKGQGTGTVLVITLVDVEAGSSINAAMLEQGLARLERRKRWDTKERHLALDQLEEFQDRAKGQRLKMWQYGDIQSDDEDSAPPARKAGGRR